MKASKLTSVILTILMIFSLALTGCDKKAQSVDSIALVSKETVLKVTADMTRKQLYELFGETYGQQLSGQDGFLATYIIENHYIYSVSVYNDEANNTALGYDGQALMNSLEQNGRSFTTTRGMTVKAEDDFDAESDGDGFEFSVSYKGKFTCSMNGYNITSKNKTVAPDDEFTGNVKFTLDILNPIASASVTAAETTSEEVETTAKVETTAEAETTAGAETTVEAETTVQDTTAEATTKAPESKPDNYFIGMLEITNDADESVYIELYCVGGTLYICRVR